MSNSLSANVGRLYQRFSRSFLGELFRARFLLGAVGIGWLLWISSPFLLLGRLGFVRSFELGDAVYPQVAYVVRKLRAGEFSLWLPAQGSGTDLLGNFNSPYVNVLLYVVLPTWLAQSLIIVIVVGVAAISTFALLRRSFKCSTPIACLGGLLYGSWFLITFGGLVFAYAAGLAFALAPLVLDAFLRARRVTFRGIAPSLVLGLIFAAGGHYTWSIFVLAVVSCCAFLLAPLRVLCWLPHLVAIAFITAILQSPLILANLQTASFSARTFETYYRWDSLLLLIENYVSNPSVAPYGPLVYASVLLALLSVIASGSRATALRSAWPALLFGSLFFLLPVFDAAVLYIFAVFNVGGFAMGANGDFGGPFDCRLRMSRAFVASVAASLSAQLCWRKVPFGTVDRLIRGDASKVKLLLGRVGPSQMKGASAANLRLRGWLGQRWSSLRNVELAPSVSVAANALVLAALCGTLGSALYIFDLTATTLRSMRRMAVDGSNFAAYYQHPQLVELASQNPDFESYRVATVLLNGPDVTGHGPCCEPRETSLSPGFQTAYSFEIADAYMSNLTRRSVDFWDLAIVGRPGFPRADFDRLVRERFVLPQHAFTQKLYLFQPIGTGQVSSDGCIRPTVPIDFSAQYNLDMLSLDNVKFVVSAIPLVDQRLKLLPSHLRSELGALQCASEAVRLAAFRDRGLVGRPLFIYRNDAVVPRVFAPETLEIVADDNAVYQALLGRSAAELRKAAVVSRRDLPMNLDHAAGAAQIDIRKTSVLRGDHLQIEVDSDTGGIIVVSSSYSPYWRADTAQVSLPVFPAYHTFIGISVPPGQQLVDLRYRPPYSRLLGYGRND